MLYLWKKCSLFAVVGIYEMTINLNYLCLQLFPQIRIVKININKASFTYRLLVCNSHVTLKIM